MVLGFRKLHLGIGNGMNDGDYCHVKLHTGKLLLCCCYDRTLGHYLTITVTTIVVVIFNPTK